METPWQLQQIEEARSRMTERLDEALRRGLEARLAAILDGIVAHESRFDPASQLERLLYVIAALAHHARWGGLSDRDAMQLVPIAEAILVTHHVDKGTSTLSVLWGELYVARSQVLRLAGRTWESTWEHHLSQQASRRQPVGTPAFHSLAAGLRAARLGLLDVGIQALEQAMAAPVAELPPRNREQASLARIQALRLSGRVADAQTALRTLQSEGDMSPLARRDAEWEGLIQGAIATHDPSALIGAVGARGTHRGATFLLEAFLWSRATRSRQFEERLPGLRTLRKSASQLIDRSTAFRACFVACQNLDDAYDADRPLALRTRALGKSLHDASLLPSLDKELSLKAAAFRWLWRAKQTELAGFVLADYEARCRQLSRGNSGDVLGLLSDVVCDDVFRAYAAPTQRSVA